MPSRVPFQYYGMLLNEMNSSLISSKSGKRSQMLLPRNLAILKHGRLRVGSMIGKESDRGWKRYRYLI